MRPVTPRGFRDVLPREAFERDEIRRAIAAVFSAWGYEVVETPVVEVYETLVTAAGELDGTAFRLFDLDGKLLALRPDVTVGIARLVASRLAEEPGALRFRYAGEVFREHESLRGQPRQFEQLGVELIGAAGPAADAEVVALMVEALAASGLRDFTVAVGTVAVITAIVEAACDDPAWRGEVLAAAHARNVVGIDRLSRVPYVDAVAAEALRSVVRLRGGQEAISLAREKVRACGCESALDAFAEMWEILSASRLTENVTADFGVMRSFDYYTGLVAEAYAPGLGVPLGGGGRYDCALAAFGAPRPAAGFALGLERLTIALAEQDALPAPPQSGVLVGGEPAAAFAAAAKLRAAGGVAVLAPGLGGDELSAEARRRGLAAEEAR